MPLASLQNTQTRSLVDSLTGPVPFGKSKDMIKFRCPAPHRRRVKDGTVANVATEICLSCFFEFSLV